MTATRPPMSGHEGERLCLLGIDAAELYASQEWSAADLLVVTDPAETIEGLLLLIQCLQAMMTVQAAATGSPIDPASILPAARKSAALWRQNRPGR